MKEKGKKIITLSIILFMVLNYLLPLVNYAEFDFGSIKDVIVKGLDETQEEIGREYEIKETEEWDISENGDGKVIAKWNFEDKSLTITGTGKMKDWDWNSASSEDWHKKYKNIIEKIIIKNGVTNIGEYTFSGCSSITSMTIPDSVIAIGKYVFYECSNLTSINIPEGVTSIVTSMFEECSSISEIYVSEKNTKYTSIDGVLYNKERTQLIKYPSNKSDREYNIPNSVASIGTYAFEGCSKLIKITIPNSVTSIGDNAFYECNSLTSIIIPESVTSIGWSAFEGCNSLTNIAIPENITVIENDAFYGVKDIICKTNSYAHKYAEENKIHYILSDNVISNYTTEYQIKDSEEWDISENGDKSIIAKWKLKDKSITISGNGTMKSWDYDSTEDWHKKYKNVIEKVIIENGVLNIGELSFFGCSSLTSIEIPNSVTSIGNSSFLNCISLTSITIPESLTSIGSFAFEDCRSLTSITIPKNVTSIGWDRFEGCNSLTKIDVSDANTKLISIDGVLYNKEKTLLIQYPSNKSDKEFSIPNSVTFIGQFAFSKCSSLTSITIPESVTCITWCAFDRCNSLANIILPGNLTDIYEYAFSECKNLINLKIPNSVNNIEEGAFDDVKNIVCKTNSYAHKYAEENKVLYILDDEVPTVTAKYSTKEKTNKNVTVTLTANEEVQAINGWILSKNKKQLSKEYSNNTTETITIKDLVGNETKQTITINNIDKTPEQVKKVGDVNENNKIDIGDILLIKRHMAYTNSTIVANKHSNWKLSDEKTTIGDINKNGKIDIGDILKLQRYISASNSKQVAEKHKDWLNLQ